MGLYGRLVPRHRHGARSRPGTWGILPDLDQAFKTPTLRDVDRRAPYMHDGSIPTLEAVIDLYDRGGIVRPSRSELIRPLGLTARQKADLAAFLHTLTSDSAAKAPAVPH